MKNNIVLNGNKEVASDSLLKTTSLIYLKEALVNQQFEDCPGLVETAKAYGARQSEIRKAIAEYIAIGGKGRRKGTNRKYGGRLRYY